ncbi:MAG: DinB family protein [Undibacterium sp.]|jgi:uncharacterized damage-inducible protein DinB|nr:DinB family protein [Undibacterium sp.]
MEMTKHLCLMADYNQLMNKKMLEAAAKLSAEALSEDRGAFFGSVIGTLNHIAVADTIWLTRFAPFLPAHRELNAILELGQPDSLGSVLFANLDAFIVRRKLLDKTLSTLAKSLTEPELSIAVSYTNSKGVASTKNFFSLLMHVFNHQTHHRGQVTTLLSQSGIDIGVTDLVAIVPNE